MILQRVLRPWMLLKWIYRRSKEGMEEEALQKKVKNFTKKFVERRQIELKNSAKVHKPCFLNFMLTAAMENPNFALKNIEDEVTTLMFAVRKNLILLNFTKISNFLIKFCQKV